jgi:hypothetical protein
VDILGPLNCELEFEAEEIGAGVGSYSFKLSMDLFKNTTSPMLIFHSDVLESFWVNTDT